MIRILISLALLGTCIAARAEYHVYQVEGKKPVPVVVIGVATHEGTVARPGDLLVVPYSEVSDWTEQGGKVYGGNFRFSVTPLPAEHIHSVSAEQFDRAAKRKHAWPHANNSIRMPVPSPRVQYPPHQLTGFFTHTVGGTEILRARYDQKKRNAPREPGSDHIVPRPPHIRLAVSNEEVFSPILLLGMDGQTGMAKFVPMTKIRDWLAHPQAELPIFEVAASELAVSNEKAFNFLVDHRDAPPIGRVGAAPSSILTGINPLSPNDRLHDAVREKILPWLAADAEKRVERLFPPSGTPPWPFYHFRQYELTGDSNNPRATIQLGETKHLHGLLIGSSAKTHFVVTRENLRSALEGMKEGKLRVHVGTVASSKVFIAPTGQLDGRGSDLPLSDSGATVLTIPWKKGKTSPLDDPLEATRLLNALREEWGENAPGSPHRSLMARSEGGPEGHRFSLSGEQTRRLLFSDRASYGGVHRLFSEAGEDPKLREEVLRQLGECKGCKLDVPGRRGNTFRENYFSQLNHLFPAHEGNLGYLIDPDAEVDRELRSFLLMQEEIGEETIPELEIIREEKARIISEKGLPHDTTEKQLRDGYKVGLSTRITDPETLTRQLAHSLREAGHEKIARRLFDALEGGPVPLPALDAIFAAEGHGEGAHSFASNTEGFRRFAPALRGSAISPLREVVPDMVPLPAGAGDTFSRRVALRTGDKREVRKRDPREAEEAFRKWKADQADKFGLIRGEHLKRTLELVLPLMKEEQFQLGDTPLEKGEIWDRLTFRVLDRRTPATPYQNFTGHPERTGRDKEEKWDRLSRLPQTLLDWLQVRGDHTIESLDQLNREGRNPLDAPGKEKFTDQRRVEISLGNGEEKIHVPLAQLYGLILQASHSPTLDNPAGLTTKEMRVFLRETIARDEAMMHWQDYINHPEYRAETLKQLQERLAEHREVRRIPKDGRVGLTEQIRQRQLATQPHDLVTGAEWNGYRDGAYTWQRRDAKAELLGRPLVQTPEVKRKPRRKVVGDAVESLLDRGRALGSGIKQFAKTHWKALVGTATVAGVIGAGIANWDHIAPHLSHGGSGGGGGGTVLVIPGGSPNSTLSIAPQGSPGNELNQGEVARYFRLSSDRPLTELPTYFNFPQATDAERMTKTVPLRRPTGALSFTQDSLGKSRVDGKLMGVPYSPGFAPIRLTIPGVDPDAYEIVSDPLNQFLAVRFKTAAHDGKAYDYVLDVEHDPSLVPSSQAVEFEGLDRRVLSRFIEEVRAEGMTELADSLAEHTRINDPDHVIHLTDVDRAFHESGLYSDTKPSDDFTKSRRFSEFRRYLHGETLKYICGPSNCFEKVFGSEYFKETGQVHVTVENQLTFHRDPTDETITSEHGHLRTLARLNDNSAALILDATPRQMDPATAAKLAARSERGAAREDREERSKPKDSSFALSKQLLEALFRLNSILSEADPRRRKIKIVIEHDSSEPPPEEPEKLAENTTTPAVEAEESESQKEGAHEPPSRPLREEVEIERVIPDGVSYEVHMERMRQLQRRKLELFRQLEHDAKITRRQIKKNPPWDRVRGAHDAFADYAHRQISFEQLRDRLHGIYPALGFDQASSTRDFPALLRKIKEHETDTFLSRFEWRRPEVRRDFGYLKRTLRPLELFLEYMATVDWDPVDSRWAAPIDCLGTYGALGE